jgi:hypothetical protein
MRKVFGVLVGGLLALCMHAGAANRPPPDTAAPATLDPQIDEAGEFWKLTSDGFMQKMGEAFFTWNTPGPNGEAHYPGYGNSPLLSFMGFRVYEANVGFGKGVAKSVSLTLFSRGDAGEIPQKNFEELVKKLDGALQARMAGVKAIELPKQTVVGVTIQSKRWIKPPYRMTLQWSAMRGNGGRTAVFRAESVKVEIEPAATANDGRNAPAVALKTGSSAKTSDLKKNLKKEEDGTVWITGMPMVDQGQKGYCAVATVERVMRYYGSAVDENLLAGIANSSAGGGTDPFVMMTALKQSGPKLGLTVRMIEDLDMRVMSRMFEAYNRTARKEKKNLVPIGQPDIGAIYSMLDPKILMDVRCKGVLAPQFQRFKREIAQKIDAGIPLLWGVELGLYPEPEIPQASGGHMRLIIGYNQKKNEIVYSDSWGADHARKTMSMEQAWSMTTMLAVLEAWKN